MDRRNAVKKILLMLGSTLALPDVLSAIGNPNFSSKILIISELHSRLIAEIAEVIIPTTATPGAKAAGVPMFIEKIIVDFYKKKEQDLFFVQLNNFEDFCKKTIQQSFLTAEKTEKNAMIEALENSNEKSLFYTMKELTVLGYFTSEIGATQALRYEDIPGRYESDIFYKKGDRAWAN